MFIQLIVTVCVTFHCITSETVDFRLFKKLEREYNKQFNSSGSMLQEETLSVGTSVAKNLELIYGLFRDTCMENDAALANLTIVEAYDAGQRAKNCFKSHFNLSAIKEECKNAPLGEVNMVFNRYCEKRNYSKLCTQMFMNSVSGCLTEGLLDTYGSIRIVAEANLDFICKREADVIGTFLLDDGPECMQGSRAALFKCYDDNVKRLIVPSFKFGQKECRGFDRFGKCALLQLKKCKEPTVANLAEMMMSTSWRKSPCNVYGDSPLPDDNPEDPVPKDTDSDSNNDLISILINGIDDFLDILFNFGTSSEESDPDNETAGTSVVTTTSVSDVSATRFELGTKLDAEADGTMTDETEGTTTSGAEGTTTPSGTFQSVDPTSAQTSCPSCDSTSRIGFIVLSLMIVAFCLYKTATRKPRPCPPESTVIFGTA